MSEKRNLVPTWKVKVDENDVDKATFKGTLRRVTVNDPINAVGKAVLEFEASFGGENKKELLKESEFKLGNKVEIGLGYKENVKKVFEGFMTSFEISYTTTKKIVRVVCSNILYKTFNGKKARTFEKKCCSDILKEILREHGIANDVEEIKIEKEYVSQEDKTDFEYILSTAQKFGMNLSCKESKVYIATDLDKKIKGDTISLEFGHNLISFKGREDVENQISLCTFVGTNCAKNERIEGAAAANDIPLQIGKESLESRVSGGWTSIFKNDTLQSNEEAKTLAKAVLQNVSMNYQRAEAQSEGENGIFPGKRIVIKAVDSRFSGTWLVERVVHDCAKVQGGFTTTVHLKRNKSGDDDNDRGSDRSVSAIEQERVASEEVEGKAEKVEEKQVSVPKRNGTWTGEIGNSKWVPNSNYSPKKFNKKNQTWGEILENYPDKNIEFKNGYPNFDKFRRGKKVKIKDFSTNRRMNFSKADAEMAKLKGVSKKEVFNWRKKNKYTWHEEQDCKSLQKVPSIIHGNVHHCGGVSIKKNIIGIGGTE